MYAGSVFWRAICCLDWAAWSSYSEGGPRTTIEAMACGVSVITTKVGTMPDIITHRENGQFIDFDVDSIVREVKWNLDNPDKVKDIAKAGRESIQFFDRKNLIKELAEGYQKLVTAS